MENIVYAAGAILIAVLGVCLTIFDLPGNGLMLLSTYAFVLFSERDVDMSFLFMVTLVYIVGELWEAGMSFFGIKKEKISWKGVFVIGVGGFVGTIIGTGIFPILGSFIGGCIGAFGAGFLYTYLNSGDRKDALHIAWQSAKVRFLAMLGKITAGFVLGGLLIYLVIFKPL